MRYTFRSARQTTPTAVVVALFLLMLPAAPGAAATHKAKAPCKQIKEAVQAGKTLQQIAAEFQVDEQTVIKCTQGKSRKRKPSTGAAKPKHSSAAAQHPSGGAAKAQSAPRVAP